MPVLSLMAKVGADITGFMTAMGKVKAATAPIGTQIGQQLRGKILEGFGVAGAIGMIKSQLSRAREIDIGASSNGVSTSTYQALEKIAERSGKSIGELVEEMNSGGEAGQEFADAVAAVRDEMEGTGQLIDEATIQRINDFNDKLSQMFGRLAPGFAFIIDSLIKVYDFLKRVADFVVGMGIAGAALIGGNAEMVQAGVEQMTEATSGTGEQDPTSAVGDAVDRARRIRRREREGRDSSQQHYRPLDVSSSTSVGGYRNPMSSMSAENFQAELRAMNSNLRDINASLRRGVE